MDTNKEAEEQDSAADINADIYEEFKIKPIIETIQTDQLRWFGHVMR